MNKFLAVISDPKNMFADFVYYKRKLLMNLRENLLQKMGNKGSAGGQRPFGFVPEIQSFCQARASYLLSHWISICNSQVLTFLVQFSY